MPDRPMMRLATLTKLKINGHVTPAFRPRQDNDNASHELRIPLKLTVFGRLPIRKNTTKASVHYWDTDIRHRTKHERVDAWIIGCPLYL
jgi:hypothetical protein